MLRRSSTAAVLVLAPALVLAATASRASAGRPAAAAAARTDVVGALFALDAHGRLGTHFCTATVVDSPKGDIVVTAAHCLTGQRPGSFAFVPGYRHGKEPLGIWTVRRIVVDAAWASSDDPDHDFAFLVVRRSQARKSLEALAGGERLRTAKAAGKRATVVGYPSRADAAIECTNALVAFTPTQLEFDCDGYTNGTSGSALVIDPDPATGLGTVVGVIGGYQEGGLTPAVSYAAAFGVTARALYRQAISLS